MQLPLKQEVESARISRVGLDLGRASDCVGGFHSAEESVCGLRVVHSAGETPVHPEDASYHSQRIAMVDAPGGRRPAVRGG